MTLTMTLQYIDTLSGGRKRFRRRFPKAVQEIIGQEFFQVPMKAREGVAVVNEREALISQFNKLVKDAQRQAKGIDPVTPRERWVSVIDKAQSMVDEVVVSPSGDHDQDDDLRRSVLADQIEREGNDPMLYRAVVAPSTPTPEPTLQDAKNIYRQERMKDTSGRNQVNRLDRVCRRLIAVLGPLESIPLSSLRRVHGRKFRDHMLNNEFKADGLIYPVGHSP